MQSVSNTTEPGSITEEKRSSLSSPPTTLRDYLRMLMVLFKMRIVTLLLVAATGGAFMAAEGWPGWTTLALVWITGGLAAGGASALNQYLERHKDEKMGRTMKKRPLVNGEIPNPQWVPWVGSALILIPVIITLTFNKPLSFFLALGALIYVVIYTMWLKPRTLLNIVIGGAAGSAAILSGSAAAGHWNNPGAFILALILFLWTPFHFWSLAIMYRDDYARADVPMLPVHTTAKQAAWWTMSHTAPTCFLGLLLSFFPYLGLVYLLPMLFISSDLFWRNVKLIREPSREHARGVFISSNIYLTILLLSIIVSSMLPSPF
ncbi:MAG: protoheme IX farnesyltransferase [Chloroflexi bacterium]|nr:MAG: protoheme IX farnesyltransferase [Chloroflexota bacterium]PIE80776.1 MAG: protoheme IX farnesyltransferase [Chloroflexota bacterium]